MALVCPSGKSVSNHFISHIHITDLMYGTHIFWGGECLSYSWKNGQYLRYPMELCL